MVLFSHLQRQKKLLTPCLGPSLAGFTTSLNPSCPTATCLSSWLDRVHCAPRPRYGVLQQYRPIPALPLWTGSKHKPGPLAGFLERSHCRDGSPQPVCPNDIQRERRSFFFTLTPSREEKFVAILFLA